MARAHSDRAAARRRPRGARPERRQFRFAMAGARRHDASMPTPPIRRFDRAYYDRFYRDPSTRVSDLGAVRKLARLVAAWTDYLEVPVRHILDVGCGLGHWRTAARTLWPRARWHGVEFSEHLCRRHGWTQGSIVDFDPLATLGRATFDLVICQGVLQYLDDRDAATALRNLARWSHGAMYFEALTRQDWERHCDRTRTDGAVHLRTGAWYRRRLTRDFQDCGGCVFVNRRAGCVLFELEGS